MKVSRPRRKNAAQAEVKESSDRQGPVEQADPQEYEEQHRRQLLSVRRRSDRSSVVSQRGRLVSSKVSGKLSHRKIRHRVRMNRYNSARRHPGRLWARLSKANREKAHNQDLVSRSRLRPVKDRQVKLAPNKKEKGKEDRLLVASRLRQNSDNAHSRSSGSKVARLVQPIRNRAAGSRKAGKGDNRDKHRRQGSNNILAQLTPAAPDVKTPESLFV